MERYVFGATITFIGCALLWVGYIIYYDVTVSKPAFNAWSEKCFATGGEVLDHTKRIGKVTEHNYTCIDKKALIDIQ